MYFTTNPRRHTTYTARRSRGKPLPAPVTVDVSALCHRADVGMLITPAAGDRTRTLAAWPCAWAADTGNYTRPVALPVYLDWLHAHAAYRQRCQFATAPDVVGDAAATWALSAPALPQIRALGYRAALVAQDGLEALPVDWDAFDCLFLGGSTAWKLSPAAWRLADAAKRRGKWLHMGRVNSLTRLRVAQQYGCDSADGTCLAFNPPQYVREIAGWLTALQRQPALPLALE